MFRIVFRGALFILLLLSLLIVSFDSNAQKKKKKKKNTEPTEVRKEASFEEKRKAEIYHVEAEKYYLLEDFNKSFVLFQPYPFPDTCSP